MPMIATTIISSIRVKPFCSFFIWILPLVSQLVALISHPADYEHPPCQRRSPPERPISAHKVTLQLPNPVPRCRVLSLSNASVSDRDHSAPGRPAREKSGLGVLFIEPKPRLLAAAGTGQ